MPQLKCTIHNKFDDKNVEYIHKNVCVNGEDLTEHEGKHYCLLHLPTQEKNIVKFEQIFRDRLEEVKQKIVEVEAKLPQDEQAAAKIDIEYAFSYVWFPSAVNLSKYRFLATASFSNATFSAHTRFDSAIFLAKADFKEAIFSDYASFDSATFSDVASFRRTTFSAVSFSKAIFSSTTYFSEALFSAYARFSEAIFSADASFSEAIFSVHVDFNEAIFSANTDFSRATFLAHANFNEAIFSAEAYFKEAKFKELSQTLIRNTRFCSLVRFYEAIFEGYIEFENNVFLNKEQVQQTKKELEAKFDELKQRLAKRRIKFDVPTDFIKDNQESVLDLRKARLKNPERISFNSVRLRPSWFVNVDSRLVVFNNITWQNIEIDIDRQGLDEERKSLKERKVTTPDEALIKACNQLSDNAEANRRFEEAKKFRKLGIALEDHKCHIHDGFDDSTKVDIRQKVCQNYPAVNEDGGNYYCLLHNPDKTKVKVFLKQFEILHAAKHTDFRAVNFPISVKYANELPKDLNFSHATFQRQVVFENADIHNLNFNESHFYEDSELLFKDSGCKGKITFENTDFDGRFFLNGEGDYEFFKTSDKALSLKGARFGKPNLVNFRSVRLRPHYFVDVDASKFAFTDCEWLNAEGKRLNVKTELENIEESKTKKLNPLLTKTCWQLADNHEESKSFPKASIFRHLASESKRLEEFRGWKVWSLHWWYWLSSFYGESPLQAGLVLAGILFLFAIAFMITDFQVCPIVKSIPEITCEPRTLYIWEAILQSLATVTFQSIEYIKPNSKISTFLIILEKIFVPLQAALLALAIRRKFMR